MVPFWESRLIFRYFLPLLFPPSLASNRYSSRYCHSTLPFHPPPSHVPVKFIDTCFLGSHRPVYGSSTQRPAAFQAQRLPLIVSIRYRTHYNDSSSVDDGLEIFDCLMTAMLASSNGAISPACSLNPSRLPINFFVLWGSPFYIILYLTCRWTRWLRFLIFSCVLHFCTNIPAYLFVSLSMFWDNLSTD